MAFLVEVGRSCWRLEDVSVVFSIAASMRVFIRVFRYVKRRPAMATGTLACAICGTLMVVVFPAVTR